jgi:hypothetical protein
VSLQPISPLQAGVKIIDDKGGPSQQFQRHFNTVWTNLKKLLDAAGGAQDTADAAQATAEGAQPADADLSAIAALSSTGFAVRTGSDTWATRSLAAGSGIGITNTSGAGGNPSISVTAAAAQTDSTATDVAGIVADFNSLLGKLRTAGLLAP